MGDYTARVSVGAPVRGGGTQPGLVFRPAECVISYSWGAQPATGLIDWAQDGGGTPEVLLPLCAMTIELAGHTFWGYCESAVPVLGTDGRSLMQQFLDLRGLMDYDTMYCAFNVRIRPDRLVDGVVRRRYMSLLPADFATNAWVFHDVPYTAAQILNFLFTSPDCGSPWTGLFHPFMNNPVYELDWTSGRKLQACVLEVSEKLGLVFTMAGAPYQLVWVVKGIGPLPVFPANSNNRRGPGLTVSKNPTRIKILGDRNLYQILNIDLERDWASGWQAFYDFNGFVEDIFLHESTEAHFGSIGAGTAYADIDGANENNAGWLLARARAQVITVEQYANLVDARGGGNGNLFRDRRKYQGRSRMQLPAAVYLQQILFRAFRFPAGFRFRNRDGNWVGLNSLDVLERSVVQVTHDPATGEMFYDTILPSQPNGYAIVQGYAVGADMFRGLRPEYFSPDQWIGQQRVWASQPFHVDDSGEGTQFILFDEQVIRSDDLIQQAAVGVGQAYVNGAATVQVPAVRVAVTFAAEKFAAVYGLPPRDEVENVSGLNAECVGYADGSLPVELTYGDGLTALEKAAQLAAPLLNGQLLYVTGGYEVAGSNRTALSAMIDRVTVRLSAGGGLTEEVDYANERSRSVSVVTGPRGRSRAVMHLEPERDFDRRAQIAPLVAGQAELRDQANQLRSEAGLLLKNPGLDRLFVVEKHLLMGLDGPAESVLLVPNEGGPVVLAIGTPLFRPAAGQHAQTPDDGGGVLVTDAVFLGVTVVGQEGSGAPVRVTGLGKGGVVQARVKGPVSPGDAVGTGAVEGTNEVPVQTYLLAEPGIAVGVAQAAVAADVVALIPVRVTGGGDAGGDTLPVWL